jgi:hypothetical protein
VIVNLTGLVQAFNFQPLVLKFFASEKILVEAILEVEKDCLLLTDC